MSQDSKSSSQAYDPRRRAEVVVEERFGRPRPLRVLSGNNLVFITADEGEPYMIKFAARYNAVRLRTERAIYEFVAEQVAVPVPRVEAVVEEGEWAFSLREMVEGEPLADLVERGEAGPDLYRQAGNHLARLHTITFSEMGILRPDVTVGPVEVFTREEYVDLLRTLHEAHLVEDPVYGHWLHHDVEPYFEGQPVLCHGDYHGGHLIVRDGNIAAVIDFEWAMAAPPMDDIATFDLMVRLRGTPDEGHLAAYYEGYRAVRPLPKGFEEDVEFYRFYRTITMLAYQARAEGEEPLDADLERALEERFAHYVAHPELPFDSHEHQH
jgi:aminoglycoside phosphotransferase (APT) family kinase protein